MQTKVRAAFRLKAFETRPGASCNGPSDGSKALPALSRKMAPIPADHGSLVQERMAAKHNTPSVLKPHGAQNVAQSGIVNRKTVGRDRICESCHRFLGA